MTFLRFLQAKAQGSTWRDDPGPEAASAKRRPMSGSTARLQAIDAVKAYTPPAESFAAAESSPERSLVRTSSPSP